MNEIETIQGTGAVNADGKVLLFVPSSEWLPFEEFVVEGDTISLLAGDESFTRLYGSLTVDAVRRTGRLCALRVEDLGRASEAVELEARRGR